MYQHISEATPDISKAEEIVTTSDETIKEEIIESTPIIKSTKKSRKN